MAPIAHRRARLVGVKGIMITIQIGRFGFESNLANPIVLKAGTRELAILRHHGGGFMRPLLDTAHPGGWDINCGSFSVNYWSKRRHVAAAAAAAA